MKRLLCLILSLVCLTSCASLLEREYTVSSPHQEDPPPHGDAAYRVETYPALRSALLSYVEEGMEEGLLRFPTTYPGNLSVDMEKARRQLMEEEPLGCYALSELTYRTSKIIAYYEVELHFTYKVDKRTLTSLPRANSRAELLALLGKSLAAGEEGLCVYLTAFPEEETGYLDALLDEAWEALCAEGGEADGASTAEGDPSGPPPSEERPPRPELEVELYPQVGKRRVVQLRFIDPDRTPEEGGTPP